MGYEGCMRGMRCMRGTRGGVRGYEGCVGHEGHEDGCMRMSMRRKQMGTKGVS